MKYLSGQLLKFTPNFTANTTHTEKVQMNLNTMKNLKNEDHAWRDN